MVEIEKYVDGFIVIDVVDLFDFLVNFGVLVRSGVIGCELLSGMCYSVVYINCYVSVDFCGD